jgi:riboflavin synthase
MFTGLVEGLATIDRIEPMGGTQQPAVKLALRIDGLGWKLSIGESVAINGCCLTLVDQQVTGPENLVAQFEAGTETLRRTNLGRLRPNDRVNVERALATGDRLGGHYVTGHIDGVGCLIERIDDPPWSVFSFSAEPSLLTQVVSKGSIAIDGVSLTVVDVQPDRFSIALIPHTLAVTTLGQLDVGDPVNLETDLIAKYVQRQLEAMSPWNQGKHSAI